MVLLFRKTTPAEVWVYLVLVHKQLIPNIMWIGLVQKPLISYIFMATLFANYAFLLSQFGIFEMELIRVEREKFETRWWSKAEREYSVQKLDLSGMFFVFIYFWFYFKLFDSICVC